MTVAEANALAEQLDIDVDDVGICLACLSFVSFEIYGGNPHKIRGAVQSMTPWLWEEGLEVPVRMALERARQRRVAHAAEALERCGSWPRSWTAAPVAVRAHRPVIPDGGAGKARTSWRRHRKRSRNDRGRGERACGRA